MYSPPLTPFWKKVSAVVILFVAIGVVFIFSQVFKQLEYNSNIRASKASGILIEKRDLNRGSLLLVIQQGEQKIEYQLLGWMTNYDKFIIGDSINKLPNSYLFEVYRKDESGNYKLVNTVGHVQSESQSDLSA